MESQPVSTADDRPAHALAEEIDPAALACLGRHAARAAVLRRLDSRAILMPRLLAEGRRVRRELHDRVLQALAAAQRQLELHDLFSTSDRPRAQGHVATAQVALHEALAELRAVITGLAVDERAPDLEAALRAFVDSPMTGAVEVRLSVRGDSCRLPRAVQGEAFLILREAICNAVAHGDPATVRVRVDIAATQLRAWVEDDGAGFDADTVPTGAGLASMRERAALLGGAATVVTRPGAATRLELMVPFARCAG